MESTGINIANVNGMAQPIIFPAFLCLPERLVGIPVAFANLLFALVTPIARFQQKDTPGILIFLAMIFLLLKNDAHISGTRFPLSVLLQ